MIQQILPSAVVCADATADLPGARVLPEEEPLLAKCVEHRRREFTTTRHCARRAMSALGVPPAPVLPGAKGEPRWPAGVTGSMTHCDGYRAAALTRSDRFHSVGIDAERHAPLEESMVRHISVSSEREHLAALTRARSEVHWPTVMFSAKETVYKTWYPLTGRWLGFRDVRLAFDAEAGTFRARLMVPGPVVDGSRLGWFTGHWAVRDGLVLTAIALRRGR
ncbi:MULTISPECIES: 4'-phosphopantetheinyl transferase family protein [unclassified Streptomyces]|uniref:4'-phosphopantetheinyl transferase family protein n=1 Tax=unclassified Streptomyces TaxID=2593676 RepID=UPI000DAC71B1|nr:MULTISPECIES: 4'-phosphopantetheinyl transferase superfamily protein [unclassified Streptomyces]PZT72577.1 4'-phosphopantetheinyl transferase [Streptomyces sp. AC1-42T]PZT81105.1 4'-phosphopantetheinyl transferase [Streptomyces sp. AC1-42W]